MQKQIKIIVSALFLVISQSALSADNLPRGQGVTPGDTYLQGEFKSGGDTPHTLLYGGPSTTTVSDSTFFLDNRSLVNDSILNGALNPEFIKQINQNNLSIFIYADSINTIDNKIECYGIAGLVLQNSGQFPNKRFVSSISIKKPSKTSAREMELDIQKRCIKEAVNKMLSSPIQQVYSTEYH